MGHMKQHQRMQQILDRGAPYPWDFWESSESGFAGHDYEQYWEKGRKVLNPRARLCIIGATAELEVVEFADAFQAMEAAKKQIKKDPYAKLFITVDYYATGNKFTIWRNYDEPTA